MPASPGRWNWDHIPGFQQAPLSGLAVARPRHPIGQSQSYPAARRPACGGRVGGRRQTACLLGWVDPSEGSVADFLTLPSAGESGYPGMVWHANELWISYHSSHEGKTAVYLATVRVPEME